MVSIWRACRGGSTSSSREKRGSTGLRKRAHGAASLGAAQREQLVGIRRPGLHPQRAHDTRQRHFFETETPRRFAHRAAERGRARAECRFQPRAPDRRSRAPACGMPAVTCAAGSGAEPSPIGDVAAHGLAERGGEPGLGSGGTFLPALRHDQIDVAQPAQREHGPHMRAIGRQGDRELDHATSVPCGECRGPARMIGAAPTDQWDELQRGRHARRKLRREAE